MADVSTEQILRLVCEHTGQRVSLDLVQIDQYIAFARGAIALASRPAEVDDWMPFDTAPRDGSTFLATNGKLVTSCRYINEPGYVREVRDMDGRYIDQEESDGFEGFMDDEGGLPDLTHWQPYPSAPSHTTNKEK